MTEKEILQQIDLIKKQLTLLNLYPNEFEQKLGAAGVEGFVNQRLDRLLHLQKELKKWQKK